MRSVFSKTVWFAFNKERMTLSDAMWINISYFNINFLILTNEINIPISIFIRKKIITSTPKL